jgi:hypothetical protein
LEAWQQRWSDYYEELGVSPNASPAVIAAAYRAMAKDFHPDRNPSEAERMVRINDAFEVLSDPARRQRYDQAHQVYRAYQARGQTAATEATASSSQAQGATSAPTAPSVPRAKLKWCERWWVWVGAVIVGLGIIGAIDDYYTANGTTNSPATVTPWVNWEVVTATHPEGTYTIDIPNTWQSQSVSLTAGGIADLYYNYFCPTNCYKMAHDDILPKGGLAVVVYPDQSDANTDFANVNFHVGPRSYKAYLFPPENTHSMVIYYVANNVGWYIIVTADAGTDLTKTSVQHGLAQLIIGSIVHQ